MPGSAPIPPLLQPRRRSLPFPIACLFAIALFASANLAFAQETIPDTGKYVYDEAGILSAAQVESLAGWLKELEQQTGDEVKVLIVKTTQPEDFFGFVQRHSELWKLGKKGEDKAAIIAMAVDDHQFRVHTYRGLEGVLPDSWCGSLFRGVVKPLAQQGKLGEGVFEATIAVANRVADDAGVKLTGIPDRRFNEEDDTVSVAVVFIVFILIIVLVSWLNRKNRKSSWGSFGPVFGGPFGGATWGGGSFGGGSFGGGSSSGGGWSNNSGSFGGGGSSAGGGGGGQW
jgi:uncharacterized protein